MPESEQTLPSGILTFLFTDIEGSTVRWDRDPRAMQAVVRRHDDIMRSAIASHHGRVFKTVGDAFCSVFPRINDALDAAVQAQRALANEDFSQVDGVRARMAIHVGAADERDGDYFGRTPNRVARLLSVGHGGQVLLSGVAAEVAADAAPQTELRDLGEHRLKDLTVPEHIFQLLAPDLETEFPTLKSLSVLDNNLPVQLTSLIGREQELADIRALLDRSRLVTLCGAGGVGKTRCALQAGAEVLDAFKEGVWFVDLAPLSDGTLVVNAIASVFDVREPPNQRLLDEVLSYLKKKQLLLILDNCEHLVAEVSKTADSILRACPTVRILATSRESLSIDGEAVYRMPSLAVPERVKGLSAADALSYGAVALFEARGRSANPKFKLDNSNAATVADVCRRLDGIPLAIELATARLNVLSPSQLAQKLDERFRLLTGGNRAALPRQHTMRALIDWSYDHLSAQEQRLFRYFSIFSGSFTLDMATAVCADDHIAGFEVLDLLTSLVDKSLVQPEHSSDESRYRLQESTRQYARERLVECAEMERIARRHADAYVRLAEQLDNSWDSKPDSQWVCQAEPDMDNWRAALTWAFSAHGDPLIAQRLASAKIWLELAPGEGRRYLLTALTSADERTPPELIAQLELAASKIDTVFGQFKAALASAERARAIFETLGDELCLANARLCAGRALLFLKHVQEGEVMLQAALDVFRRSGSKKTMGSALSALGAARIIQGDVPEARSFLTAAGTLYKRSGADGRVPAVLSMLAEAEFRAGDAGTALEVASQALTAHRGVKSGPNVVNILYNMAAYFTVLGRYDEARAHAREALELARDEQADAEVTIALQHLAAVAALGAPGDQEAQERAARLLGFADASFDALDYTREYTEQQEYERVRTALHHALGDARLAELAQEGQSWTEERAVSEALEI